jgi:hypothetical protein
LAARPWLYGAPLAWATSAALVLAEGALWTILPLALWGLCLAGRRLRILLLAALVPLNAAAAIAAEVHGPGHFHAGDGAHRHAQVEHHRHAAGTDAIAVDDESAPRDIDVRDGKRGVPAADSLTSSVAPIAAPAHYASPLPLPPVPGPAFFGAPPERPPRIA